MQDPQEASKVLVDHALASFSTDNLSCMVVRFDNERLKYAVETETERIGVEGDPISQKGHLTEAEAHVEEARKGLNIPPDANITEETHKVSESIIKEVEESETSGAAAGLEAEPDAVKRLAEQNRDQIEERRHAAIEAIREERGSDAGGSGNGGGGSGSGNGASA